MEETDFTTKTPNEEPSGHRWSGWPGAWCLDCGIEDPTEYCIANHEQPCDREECQVGLCEQKGEANFDPYKESDHDGQE